MTDRERRLAEARQLLARAWMCERAGEHEQADALGALAAVKLAGAVFLSSKVVSIEEAR